MENRITFRYHDHEKNSRIYWGVLEIQNFVWDKSKSEFMKSLQDELRGFRNDLETHIMEEWEKEHND